MIRRLIALSLVGYAIYALLNSRSKRSTETNEDAPAQANWESEGGSPLADVTTPA